VARVMLVDDDPGILRTIEIALQAVGHEVIRKATSAEEALAALSEDAPDIMIVDVMMPTGTEGFHLVWAVRRLEDEVVANVPIIMATGIHETTELRFYPDKTDGTYEPGEFLPVQGWVDKPIKVNELASQITRLLGAVG